jgi:L-aspartate oxidase
MRIETDFLVVGSGVAGLTFALKAAETGRVLIITKSTPEESNSWYAQGGIAGVFAAGDSFEDHIRDTLVAGAGLCNEEVVRRVVTEGPARIRELMAYGVSFDRQSSGDLMLGREGGHSQHRILHSKDATGRAISSVLLDKVRQHSNITLTDQLFAVDLLTQHHLGLYVNRGNPDIACYGVYALNYAERQVYTILSRCTVLASGGCGCVYATTTNPSVATGDGIAMVLRAKGRIANMEFIQFHPTALYEPGKQPAFLITEALRGKGALLLDPLKLDRFMPRYDSRAELAPRDIVARAIDQELKLSGLPHVWLDATHIPASELKDEFPTIYEYCLSKGYDLTSEPIPVLPAAHYLCGGIEVDQWGRSSIARLYAIGECSNTGLHGANRLASNSLLEALVYGSAAAEHAREYVYQNDFEHRIPDWNARDTDNTEEWVLISHNLREVQSVMSDYVGIVRSNLRLERAARRIDLIYRETESFYQRTRISPPLCELRNLIACAYLIIKCAKIRRESRGLHTTLDYPETLSTPYPTRV